MATPSVLRTLLLSAAVSLLAACASLPTGPSSSAYEFALIGDVPYAEVDFPKFDNVIARINAQPHLKWVMHVGDIKTGSSLCSDEVLSDRLARMQRFEKPFMFTPGDNEWTDCHRPKAGEYQPVERLGKLRQLFYPQPGVSLGKTTMKVETQANSPRYAKFVENTRWSMGGITYAGLHIIGSNNGLAPFDPASKAKRTKADDDEVAERTAATLAWIKETFEKAKADNARGVFLFFQANPGFHQPKGHAERVGFEEFIAAFEQEAIAFGKPVILAQGDSHYFRIDKPLMGTKSKRRIENVTRVETFGEDDVHWIRVTVDPDSAEVFSFHQEIIPANLVSHR